MERIREVLSKCAVENGCAIEELYEQLDYCIDSAIENAYFSANEFAISFWEALSRKNKDFSAEDVILAICGLIQKEKGAVSEGNDSSLV